MSADRARASDSTQADNDDNAVFVQSKLCKGEEEGRCREAHVCNYFPVIRVDAAGDIQSAFALALWKRYCIIAKETTGVVESRVREGHNLSEYKGQGGKI